MEAADSLMAAHGYTILELPAGLSLAVWLWAWFRRDQLIESLEGPDAHKGAAQR